MRTASGLALVAIGAILAFAVTTSPHFLNLHIAGWVLIVTGVAGMVIRRPVWRRVVRRPRGAAVNPGGGRRSLGTGGRVLRWVPHPGPGTTRWLRRVSDGPDKYVRVGATTPAGDVVAGEAAPGSAEPAVETADEPAVETADEYFQE